MKIDIHGHVTAPDSLYAWKAGLTSHRGAHGRGSAGVTDETLREALYAPNKTFGGLSHIEHLDGAGVDIQLISPRPYQMMHSEQAHARRVVRRGDQRHHRADLPHRARPLPWHGGHAAEHGDRRPAMGRRSCAAA